MRETEKKNEKKRRKKEISNGAGCDVDHAHRGNH